MADAHSLLSESRWQGVGLANLVRSQFAPYATDANMTIAAPRSSHGRGDPGGGDGASRAGDERCEIWGAVDPGRPGVGELGTTAGRGCEGESDDRWRELGSTVAAPINPGTAPT